MGATASIASVGGEEGLYDALHTKYVDLKKDNVDSAVTAEELKKVFDAYVRRCEEYNTGDVVNDNYMLFNIGDVVQIKDKNSYMYFEAIVTNVNTETVDVKYEIGDNGNDDDDEEGKGPSTDNNIVFQDELGIPINSDRLRKISSWEYLETGDVVIITDEELLKSLGFPADKNSLIEGIVIDVSLDGFVDINLNVHDDAKPDIKSLPLESLVKIFSKRMPKELLKFILTDSSIRERIADNVV